MIGKNVSNGWKSFWRAGGAAGDAQGTTQRTQRGRRKERKGGESGRGAAGSRTSGSHATVVQKVPLRFRGCGILPRRRARVVQGIGVFVRHVKCWGQFQTRKRRRGRCRPPRQASRKAARAGFPFSTTGGGPRSRRRRATGRPPTMFQSPPMFHLVRETHTNRQSPKSTVPMPLWR